MNRGATSLRQGLPTSAPPLPPRAPSPPAQRSVSNGSVGGGYALLGLHDNPGGSGGGGSSGSGVGKISSRWFPWPLSSTFCGVVLGAWTLYWVITMTDSTEAAGPPGAPLYPAGGGEPNSGWFTRLANAGGDAATHLALTRAGLWGDGDGSVNPAQPNASHRKKKKTHPWAVYPWAAAVSSLESSTVAKCGAAARVGVLGLPMYAYRDALADRSPSNVRDVARRAAEDRHDFESYVTERGTAKAGDPPCSRARAQHLKHEKHFTKVCTKFLHHATQDVKRLGLLALGASRPWFVKGRSEPAHTTLRGPL